MIKDEVKIKVNGEDILAAYECNGQIKYDFYRIEGDTKTFIGGFSKVNYKKDEALYDARINWRLTGKKYNRYYLTKMAKEADKARLPLFNFIEGGGN